MKNGNTDTPMFDLTMLDRDLHAWDGNMARTDSAFIRDRAMALRRDRVVDARERYLFDLLSETRDRRADPLDEDAVANMWNNHPPGDEARVLAIAALDDRWGHVAVVATPTRRRVFVSASKLRLLWEMTGFDTLHHTDDRKILAACRDGKTVGYVAPLAADPRLVSACRREHPDVVPEAL